MSVHLCACTSECVCMSVPWTHISSQCVVSQSGSGVCECVSRYLHQLLVDIQFIFDVKLYPSKIQMDPLVCVQVQDKNYTVSMHSPMYYRNTVGVHCLFPIM